MRCVICIVECLVMFFKIVKFLGQFAKQATSQNTWNDGLEKVTVFLSVLVELFSVSDHFGLMYVNCCQLQCSASF